MADISISGFGSYEVESQTEAGAAWMFENISEAESVGGGMLVAYIDGAWYAVNIADDAVGEGLEVRVNGKEYDA